VIKSKFFKNDKRIPCLPVLFDEHGKIMLFDKRIGGIVDKKGVFMLSYNQI
jgi:hypothetical protein